MANKMYREDNTRVQILKFVPPEYKVTHMIVSQNGKDLVRITFAISPSSLNESRSNNMQLSKTNAGWFGQRMGPSPISLSISGFMLDVEGYLEKHQFLSNWKSFLEDKKSAKMEYQNQYSVRLVCMGRQYFGYVQAVNFTTSATQPFLHQYSLNFMSLGDEYIYKPEKVTTAFGTYAISTKQKTILGKTVYNILTRG